MKFLVLTAALLSSAISFAGDKVGNGGGLWACMAPNQTLLKGMLVDLYEADVEFGLKQIVTAETNPINIAKERETYVMNSLPPVYARGWARAMVDVMGKLRMVNAELEKVDDALFRMRPHSSTCVGGTWSYVQFANFTHLGHILVREDLWNSPVIASVDKAALLWHEAIYSWLRKTAGDKDSVRTRQIVGIIFSQLSAQEMAAEIDIVLRQSTNPTEPPPPTTPPPAPRTMWVCEMLNRMNQKWYGGYGLSEPIAAAASLEACGKREDSIHCDDFGRQCDSFVESAPYAITCTVVNYHLGSKFAKTGRSTVEARFNARDACQKAARQDSVHCSMHADCK